MRTTGKAFCLLLLSALLLAACAAAPSTAPTTQPTTAPAASASPASVSTEPPATKSPETPAPTDGPTATPEPEPTYTPIPLPTTNITGSLPDPAKWVASLKFEPKDYPRVDGSTANIPLGVYVRAKLTGESLAACEMKTAFTKTGQSWLALANQQTDLLLVYEAPEEIKAQLTGVKLTAKPIGLDALVFLTNKGNGVKSLTQKQIIDIYTGKIKNWSKVGGEDTAIIPYQRISNSGSQALMEKLAMKGIKMMEAPSILQPAEMGELVDAIASYDNTKNALGYSVFYYVKNMYQATGVKVLAVDGVQPTNESIASKQYPYLNEFYAVIRQEEPADSAAHKIFDWLTGAEGKRAIEDAGYVAVK